MSYPVLAKDYTWYTQGNFIEERASITEIEFMDSYTPDSSVTVVSQWDASEAKDGSITCYVIGTKLFIVGNGSGKISGNSSSKQAFAILAGIQSIKGLEIFNTSNVTNMKSMFDSCESLTSIDISSFDMTNVETIECMFYFCEKLTTVNFGLQNTSKITSTASMFEGCSALESINMSGLDLSSLTDASFMFHNCSSLISVDISGWNVPKPTSIHSMFMSCSKLTSINTDRVSFSSLTTMTQTFSKCSKLTSLDLSGFGTSQLKSMRTTFNKCSALKTIRFGDCWDTKNVTTMNTAFQDCSLLSDIDVSNWNVSNVSDMSFMFYGCSSLKEIDVSNWDVSKVTTFDHFAAHANLKRKGIENWITSSATNMNALFHNCAEEELDLSNWDVSKVQFFCQMFENSPNLKRVKGLEKWNTSSGLGFDGMFERCSKLEEIDLSAFNTTKAKNGTNASSNGHTTATLSNMFLSCNNLKKVKIGANFSINGDGTNTTATNKLVLPTPSVDYIEGADGSWYTINGDAYAPNAVKDKTAETYYASFDIVADLDVIVKNGSLIDTAKAIREKNGSSEHYTPAQFGAAVRAL